MRDYVYVEDVCSANVMVLNTGDNNTFNIGSGKGIYIEDLYNIMKWIIGKNIPLTRRSERIGDVKRSVLDCARAKAILMLGIKGWS